MDDEKTNIPTTNKKLFTLPAGFDPNVRVNIAKPVSDTKAATVRTARVSLEGKIGSRVDARDYRGNGHWIADIDMGVSKAVGFVYVIRNLEKRRFYIGKKLYRSTGKVTKGQTSNWAWYTSSCNALVADALQQQKAGFEYIFIEEYVSKGALSWAETWSICHYRIPENPDMFYNTMINKISWRVKEHITSKHVERLARAIKGDPFD